MRIRIGLDVRFIPVSIGDRVVEFAVHSESSDPIACALAERRFPGDCVNTLWLHLATPGSRVVDVGAHLGVYTLPAAAAGAHVLSIEASRTNAHLLDLAVRRNGFADVQLLRAIAADRSGTAAFIAHGPYGHVATPDELDHNNAEVEVAAVTIDEVLSERGWDDVRLVKIDVEGSELAVLTLDFRALRGGER